jgi:hypothetical protein
MSDEQPPVRLRLVLNDRRVLPHQVGQQDSTLGEHAMAAEWHGPCATTITTSDGCTWWCTRLRGHSAEHRAGTGAYIALAWFGGTPN